jgi:hypothetical protein
MSDLGHQRTSGCVRAESVHPPTADVRGVLRHVAFGPEGDIGHLPSFNDLVGAAEQGKWHGEAKRLCRLHVDYEFELCDLLHR